MNFGLVATVVKESLLPVAGWVGQAAIGLYLLAVCIQEIDVSGSETI